MRNKRTCLECQLLRWQLITRQVEPKVSGPASKRASASPPSKRCEGGACDALKSGACYWIINNQRCGVEPLGGVKVKSLGLSGSVLFLTGFDGWTTIFLARVSLRLRLDFHFFFFNALLTNKLCAALQRPFSFLPSSQGRTNKLGIPFSHAVQRAQRLDTMTPL